MHQSDMLIATTVAQTTRDFASHGTSVEAGLAFERALYTSLLDASNWRFHSGPDELDMGGALQSRTGIHYEFDTVLLTADTLYIVEAKRHAHVTRLHISEFLSKLLDVTLGSAQQLSSLHIKPVFVSGLPHIDAAAWSYAVSWGILLISPSRPTPWELLAALHATRQPDTTHRLASDCEELGRHLWRPLNAIITPTDPSAERFEILATAIYTAGRVSDILQFWSECQSAVTALTSTQLKLLP